MDEGILKEMAQAIEYLGTTIAGLINCLVEAKVIDNERLEEHINAAGRSIEKDREVYRIAPERVEKLREMFEPFDVNHLISDEEIIKFLKSNTDDYAEKFTSEQQQQLLDMMGRNPKFAIAELAKGVVCGVIKTLDPNTIENLKIILHTHGDVAAFKYLEAQLDSRPNADNN